MPKVCIVTFFKHNFGAFLQAYALQRMLGLLHADAELLDYDYARDRTFLGVPFSTARRPLVFSKSVLYRLMRRRVRKETDAIFRECAERLIPQTRYYRTYKDVKATPPDADVYLVGSDQVWNPEMAPQGFLSRLLDFAPEESRVLASYAASIGKNTLSDHDKKMFMEKLARFDALSVREASSAALLDGLTDKPVLIHKDPTLLLTSDEWDEFARNVPFRKPYLFLYLVQNDFSLVSKAVHLAKDNGWGIVDCHSSANYSLPGSLNGNGLLSPPEFVGAIREAEYVVTNSFHCLVFSTHYRKRAFVKFPPRLSGRLRELVEACGLRRLTQDRLVESTELEDIYARIPAHLASEREKAKKYLENLLEIARNKRQNAR